MCFGERIRELRLKKGWKLDNLAERVGVSHAQLCPIENKRLNYGEYPSACDDATLDRLLNEIGPTQSRKGRAAR